MRTRKEIQRELAATPPISSDRKIDILLDVALDIREQLTNLTKGEVVGEKEWRMIPGTQERYKVSNMGEVYSMRLSRVMKLSSDWRGYQQLTLTLEDGDVTRKAHTLVMLAFVGPRQEGMTVNHKNGDKRDNRLSNLEYCSQSENMEHSWRTGLRKTLLSKEQQAEAIRLFRSGRSQTSIGKEFGVSQALISRLVVRDSKHV